MKQSKKLIEVALPLEAINSASAREKSIRHGHPSTLHLWWARRPLAAARAVIFAQMVDDPSAHPDLFPTKEAQDKERQRLFGIIEELVKWENTTNEAVLQQGRDAIWQSWRRTCAKNADHPRAKELFDRHKLPAFHDPFAGGGALALEAQRLGLESYASDLNPVAVLINKAMIEIPPKFAGRPPVNPEAQRQITQMDRSWKGAQGLAEDVRYYGRWMRDEAERRIGHLYPKVEVTAEMAGERPDLKKHIGQKLTVIAWLWARTVKSPNPAFADVDVPLVSTFMLSTRPGKEAYVEPVMENDGYRFTVKVGKPKDAEAAKNGNKLSRGANFRCLISGEPITGSYVMAEGKANRIGTRMMAIVAESACGRVYLSPTEEMEAVAHQSEPLWKPDIEFFQKGLGFRIGNYGMAKWSDLFTSRQLMGLSTFSELVHEARKRVEQDALAADLKDEGGLLDTGRISALAYSEAVALYLAFGVSKTANRANNLATWMPSVQCPGHLFRRHAIPMSWDFCEGNSVTGPSGSFWSMVNDTARALDFTSSLSTAGIGFQADAAVQASSFNKVISTDPPYYDNVGYADLSDFFYVWLRQSLKSIHPQLFTTLTVPKAEELVATPDRHGSKKKAEDFFLNGMTEAMRRLAEQAHPVFPISIYYAFKQSENDGEEGISRTGWETFLDAIESVGFVITGTWPIHTERENRTRNQGSNALASSIVLVCRKRPVDAPTTSRREFLNTLKAELPQALAHLQRGNIAPVDLAQAAIGPGMAVYTRYEKVLDGAGKALPVREALALINQVLDEALAEQEGDFDADSRWALAWFEQFGFAEGEYGMAEQLSKSKNTAVGGLAEAGILISKGGKVRLLKSSELRPDWDPETDTHLTVWEMVHHLIRALEAGGDKAAAAIVAKLGTKAEVARELCYRLYTLCERRKRATEALAYNALVQSWPEISRLAQESGKASPAQAALI